MNPITIITACIRPSNLPVILRSMTAATEKAPAAMLRWVIIQDWAARPNLSFPALRSDRVQVYYGACRQPGFKGRACRNDGIKCAVGNNWDGHLTFLDDDTIMHPDFLATVTPVLGPETAACFPMVGQQDSGVHHAQQVVLPIPWAAGLRFREDGAGQDFVPELMRLYGRHIVRIGQALTYHNKLVDRHG